MIISSISRLLLAAFLLISIASCDTTPKYQLLSGKTMGTTYSIKYAGEDAEGIQSSIDSLLIALNQSVSTYIPSSTISRFNSYTETDQPFEMDADMSYLYQMSKQVNEMSSGAFDPTVMPLVNAWGFGFEDYGKADSSLIDSLKKLVGMSKVFFYRMDDTIQGPAGDSAIRRNYLVKEYPDVMLDFSAIAKGYGVDQVARYLEEKGVSDYLVEIGGEVRCRGINDQGEVWRVGIDRPIDANAPAGNDLVSIVSLENMSLATSGNYRNFYILDGRKVAHTINPGTGYPEINDLLSVSVFHPECMLADAWATAFMVLGFKEAWSLVNKLPGFEAYFIYIDADGNLQEAWTEGASTFRGEEQ